MPHLLLMLRLAAIQQDFRCGNVRGKRHVVNIADLHEGGDVWFMRVRRKGIAEEDHRVNLAGCSERSDLEITTERAGEHLANFQSSFLDQGSGRVRRDNGESS